MSKKINKDLTAEQKLILFEEKQNSEDEIKFTRNLFFAVILIILLIFYLVIFLSDKAQRHPIP